MAKRTTVSKAIEESEEPVQQEEETVDVHSSASESDSESKFEEEEDDIEGLLSADEAEGSGLTHKVKKLDVSKQKKTGKKSGANADSIDYSNIIYVSRLPQGFHEKELSKYFSQFGDLKEVKLARNKKNGNSRHYGFIEFANKDDARIAQETMNNYLLMGHLLQVRLLPEGSKIEKLYKYKKRAFQETPIKRSADQLKEGAKIKHDERMEQLHKAGIQFEW